MADNAIEPINLFSVPIFKATMKGHEEHRQALIDEIVDFREKNPGIRRSNRNGWHSPERFSRSPHMQWVLQSVSYFARAALARYYDWDQLALGVSGYWANILGPGGWNAPHHHSPQHWSACYYVDVELPGPGADELEGMIEFLNPMPWQAIWGGSGNFAQQPKNGMAIVFPAPLIHLVHPHTQDMERISIAMNFQVMPRPPASVQRR